MLLTKHIDTLPEDFLDNLAEGVHFHRAFRESEIEGFDIAWLAVFRNGDRVTVAPYFVMDFYFNTMLADGWLKSALSWLKFKIVCVGHPSSDVGHIDGEISREILTAVNAELSKKASIVAYKGFHKDIPINGFIPVMGLPDTVLQLSPDYYSKLSAEKRRNLRRKRKAGESLRVVEHDGQTTALDEQLVDKIYRLYLNTYERADVRFEKLSRTYFIRTASISIYLLFYEGPDLIGFAQMIGKKPCIALKYGGFDYEKGEKYDLYFQVYLRAIDLCIRDGYSRLESGVSSYGFKRFLGSEMVETWVHYRHANKIAHWLLGKLAFLLKPSEADLK